MFTSTITTLIHSNHTNTTRISMGLGIFWKIISCLCFAGINIIVRYLSGSTNLPIEQKLPSLVIMFFQNFVGAILLLPFIVKDLKSLNIFKGLVYSKHYILHITRIITAIFGIALWYISLAKMPVPQVVAISFISPILTMIGAAILLKENLSLNKYSAIFFSFLGGFLITRPDLAIDLGLLQWTAIFPIGAALIFAIDKLITKKLLAQKECPKLITMYLLVFIMPLSLIGALLNNSWVVPVPANFLPLVALGALGVVANFAFNKSLEIAELTVIMPYGITKIIASSILSYLVFAEIPETISIWVGLIVISLSTILLCPLQFRWYSKLFRSKFLKTQS